MNTEISKLTVGWQVNTLFEPRYWLKADSKCGYQRCEELVQIPSNLIAAHCLIVAQSGSGKSYFLGRLIEEIIINTKCRCRILDVNGDFIRIRDIGDDALWQDSKYDKKTGLGKLPHEKTREEFLGTWEKVPIRVYSAFNNEEMRSEAEPLRIWLPELSIEFLLGDVDPLFELELLHCHKTVAPLFELFNLKQSILGTKESIILKVEELLSDAAKHQLNNAYIQNRLRELFELKGIASADQLNKYVSGETDRLMKGLIQGGVNADLPAVRIKLATRIRLQVSKKLADIYKQGVTNILSSIRFVTPRSITYYFGKVNACALGGLLLSNSRTDVYFDERLAVYDLASLQARNIRLLAINSILANEWNQAREEWIHALAQPPDMDNRVPTFIVIDEAHHLIPFEPQTLQEKVLREQIRTIAAEGRKYGIFLILVTQRPDKIDPQVVGECENKAIMKLNASSILEKTKEIVGIEGGLVNKANNCLGFGRSRVLLLGKWAQKGIITYSAARRTVEGGRDLRSEYWACK